MTDVTAVAGGLNMTQSVATGGPEQAMYSICVLHAALKRNGNMNPETLNPICSRHQ